MAICIVDETGRIIDEKKVASCPNAIADYLLKKASGLVRGSLETCPLAVWLWNELAARQLPTMCNNARHANAAWKMHPVKMHPNDVAGLAKILQAV